MSRKKMLKNISNYLKDIIRHVRRILKSDYYLRRVYLSVCPYVLPHKTIRLPLDGF